MIRCILIEDEAPAREIIKSYLKSYDDFELVAECSNGYEGMKEINRLKPDFIFLDIQMPKLTGFEMLELLDVPPMVLFTTAFDQYAIKAFECNATDYLLKPFTKKRFEESLQKVRSQINNTSDELIQLKQLVESYRKEQGDMDRVVVKSGNSIKILGLDDIICIEAADDYVLIHTEKEQYIKQSTMKQFENHLPANQFQRIHRSFIINLSHLVSMDAYTKETHIISMSNGMNVKSSRSGSQQLRKVLNS